MMDSERFARVRELFLAARALSPESRGDYLIRECAGDDGLLSEVQSLLEQKPETDRILRPGALEEMIGGDTVPEVDLPARLPENVGPYQVLGVLGVGGMGVVYRAKQTAPIEREVAVKVIYGTAGTRGVVARFESERQFLARMEHPNIAKVLDAGADEAGRPYFVMELVRGVPIVEFCHTERLSLRERLALFRIVCSAVQHAHHKGIIHRDLKPSNILVCRQDGGLHPTLIDFGIAKALSDGSDEADGMTRDGQFVGTIEYMSPERVGGTASGADTRSDVYSLGVILYEVLTGDLPYEIRRQPTLVVLRRIAETTPHRLVGRRTEWGRLDRDLEAITFKALEKEPELRYPSAGAMAEDLGRYLSGRAIRARRPTVVYQARKLVGRHKAVSALSGVLLVLAIGALAARGVYLEREKLKQRILIDTMTSILTANNIEQLGKDAKLVDVLGLAEGELDRLQDQPTAQAELRMTIGEAFSRLGMFDKAEHHLRAALATMESSGRAPLQRAILLNQLSEFLIHRGQSYEADSLLRRALTMTEKRDRESRFVAARSMNLLARTLDHRGREREAEAFYIRSIRIHERIAGDTSEVVASSRNDYAVFLWSQGRYEEAETLYEQARATYTRIQGEEHTDTATIMANHALLLTHMGRPEEAEPLQRRALAIQEVLLGHEHELVALSLVNLGLCLEGQDRFAEASPLLHEGCKIMKATLGEAHPWTAYAQHALAFNEHVQGDWGESDRHYEDALDVCSRAFPADHGEPAKVRAWRAALWTEIGRLAEAEAELRGCLEAMRIAYPADHWNIGIARNALGRCLVRLGQVDEGDSLMESGLQGAVRAPRYERTAILRRSADLYEEIGRNDRAELCRERLDRPPSLLGSPKRH